MLGFIYKNHHKYKIKENIWYIYSFDSVLNLYYLINKKELTEDKKIKLLIKII